MDEVTLAFVRAALVDACIDPDDERMASSAFRLDLVFPASAVHVPTLAEGLAETQEDAADAVRLQAFHLYRLLEAVADPKARKGVKACIERLCSMAADIEGGAHYTDDLIESVVNDAFASAEAQPRHPTEAEYEKALKTAPDPLDRIALIPDFDLPPESPAAGPDSYPPPPKEDRIECAFCGKTATEAAKMIVGKHPGACICNECIRQCSTLLDNAGVE